jgi:hypothetical protein
MNKLKQIWNIITTKKDKYSSDSPQSIPQELHETFLIDVQQGSYNSNGFSINGRVTVGTGYSECEKPMKLQVKPIDILNEIKEPPKLISLVGLDNKIEVLNIKKSLIQQIYAANDIDGMITILENRKKYKGTMATFFSQFDTTTIDKINILLEKYELVMRSADIFVPEFPDDAVKIMKQYSDNVYKICKKRPLFYVIAISEYFKSEDKKRDPILLATSPFGTFYDILGAWDKEMILLSEL